jgi:hypothetical protein
MAHFDADNVVTQIKPVGGASNTWKTILCEENLSAPATRTVNERPTKCRIIKSTSQPSVSITGTSVIETDLESDEISYKGIMDYFVAGTTLEARVINLAVDAISEGDVILVRGEGIFSECTVNANVGAAADFNWTFQITGDIDVDESDES